MSKKFQSKIKVNDGENKTVSQQTVSSVSIENSDEQNILRQVEQANLLENSQDDDRIVTMKDLSVIVRHDIKTTKRKDQLYNAAVYSMSIVLQQPQYRNVLSKSNSKGITACLQEFLKDPNYRKEVTAVLTRKLANTAKIPNYVVIFGTDFDIHVKYSKTTLMQILVAKTWTISMFEVPMIAINTMRDTEYLTNRMLQDMNQLAECDIKIIDTYSVDSRISETFKQKSMDAFKDVITYYSQQMSLPAKQQDKQTLKVIPTVFLSRMMNEIDRFNLDEELSQIKTEHNWSVVLGGITQMSSNNGILHTSHPYMLGSKETTVQFYQKMEMTFAPKGAKSRKKVQAVVYCQKVKFPEVSLAVIWENICDGQLISMNNLYYFCFLLMLFTFFLGNKLCDEIETEVKEKSNKIKEQAQPGDQEAEEYNKGQSIREMYCASQNQWTMNMGVAFLCIAAFKAYYQKITSKLEQAQTKMDRINAIGPR